MIDKDNLTEKAVFARTHRYITNCYSSDVLKSAQRIFEYGESFAFTVDDHGIDRLYLFAKDKEELDKLLGSLVKGTYFFEYMTKQPDELVPANAAIIARLMRMVNKDCKSVFEDQNVLQYRDDSVGEFAGVDDTHEINTLLWNTFHTEISHLLYDDELKEIIEAKKVVVHRGDKIDALLQVDVMPKKFYINQIINKADKSVIHAMLLALLWNYVENGGQYIYSWVEDKNIASVKFHQKYGMIHDGMWNLVYRLEL